MRIENIEMLLDTLGIFERGVYEIGDKQISVKLSKEEREKIPGVFTGGIGKTPRNSGQNAPLSRGAENRI